jgi:N-acetylglucosaminyl-diphospho-decaprenol L-rhamnosyltransferase
MTACPPVDCVTIVTVCYNSLAVLPEMLASTPAGMPVVVVDNASDDNEALESLAKARGARILHNRRNRGFGVACNQGAALAQTEFLLFLNPDAQLTANTLEELVAAARRYPLASAMNPRMQTSDGRPSFKRNSCLMPRSETMDRGWPESDAEVSVLSAAALFVRRSAFETVGGFDPAIFLYHEDDDLSRRLRRECGPLMFVREAVVRHLGGRSSERNPAVASLKAFHMGRSRVYAMRKHGRPFPLASSLWSALWQLLSPVVVFSGRKRAKQWALLQGVLSARRDGGGTLVEAESTAEPPTPNR